MPKTPDTLTAAEKDRLTRAVQDLIETLGWTPTQLARHLGYGSPSTIHKVRKAEGAMTRARFQEVLRLVENCTLPEEALPAPAGAGEREPHPWVQHARELWTDLMRRGIRMQTVAEAVGYTRATTFSGALSKGFLPEERYHSLVRFADQHRERSRPPTAQSALPLEPEPRPTGTTNAPVRKDASAAAATPAPASENRHFEPVVPIFAVLQQAHDQLGSAVRTLDRGISMANVLVAPGMKMFRTRVAEIQRTLEEALAMQ